MITDLEYLDNNGISYMISDLNGYILKEYKSDHLKNSASTIKVLIMICVLNKLEESDDTLDTYLCVPQNIIITRNSDIFIENKDYYLTIEELISWMIKISENNCTDVLIDYLGMDYINSYAINLGMDKTILNRYMTNNTTNNENFNKINENYSSLKDMYKIFSKLFNNELLNDSNTLFAIDALFNQRLNKKLPRNIYNNIQFAHKTGGLSTGISVCNDVGVIKINNSLYFIGVMIENNHTNNDENLITIGKLGIDIYNYLSIL